MGGLLTNPVVILGWGSALHPQSDVDGRYLPSRPWCGVGGRCVCV